jgi:hypothetical protein
MRVNSYCCDGCGLSKGENNHWFAISASTPSIIVSAWHDGDGYDHYCSDACVIKAVQKWLSAQKELSQKGGE